MRNADRPREIIEELAKRAREAEKKLLPLQPGDVVATYAQTSALENAIDFAPQTSVETGIAKFVDWYRAYFHV